MASGSQIKVKSNLWAAATGKRKIKQKNGIQE